MGSEPKRPKTDTFTDLHKEFAVYSHSEQQMEDHHAAWQAYAAGIRAAVLAEVRAVVPEKVECVSEGDAGYNACRAEMLQALTTLEQQP